MMHIIMKKDKETVVLLLLVIPKLFCENCRNASNSEKENIFL